MKRPEAALLAVALLERAARLLTLPLRPRARVRAMSLLVERLDPRWTNPTKYGPVTFWCPSTWPYTRSDMVKEPGTYAWIDGFADGETMWDIGANIGVYSLYAARKGHRVAAFEPSALTFSVLARNVELNGFDDRVTFLNLAVAERACLDVLNMPHTEMGRAHHSFGAPIESGAATLFRQPVLGFAVDELAAMATMPFPNHVKIDVDGIEEEIVRGAKRTLADPALRSVQIEIRPDARRQRIMAMMTEAGLVLDHVHHGKLNHVFVRGGSD